MSKANKKVVCFNYVFDSFTTWNHIKCLKNLPGLGENEVTEEYKVFAKLNESANTLLQYLRTPKLYHYKSLEEHGKIF